MTKPVPFTPLKAKYRDMAKLSIIRDYWKLDTIDPEVAVERLISLGNTSFKQELTHRRAQYLHKRQQREMVLYERCTITELKEFCANRGITLFSVGKHNAKIIIQTLEHVDHIATFPKFLLLPAELREEVYHHYLTSLRTGAVFPMQPPLLRASRQLRHETLLLFYRDRTFTISFPLESDVDKRDPTFLHQRATEYMRLLSDTGSADVLARVEKWRISGQVQYWTSMGWWSFELGKGSEDSMKFEPEPGKQIQYTPHHSFLGELLMNRLRCLRARFEARGEGLRLRTGDLDQLLQIFGRTSQEIIESKMKVWKVGDKW